MVKAWLQSDLPLSPSTMQWPGRAVSLRQLRPIKLLQAVIPATNKIHSTLLVTRNARDFPRDLPDIRVPCEI